MCPASAPGWRSGHRPGSRRADNCRGGANRPTVGWSSAPERTSRGGRDRRVRTQAKARAPEEGSFPASDSYSYDGVDGFIILARESLTSAVNEGLECRPSLHQGNKENEEFCRPPRAAGRSLKVPSSSAASGR